ncbi:MAG: ribonuclease III [Nitrospinaceae bacterium]
MVSPERIQELTSLQTALKYSFSDAGLLNKALTHKSFTNENAEAIKNNERFEFLGDSVLDLIVSDYLIHTYQDYSEGRLSKIRAAVVNETCLAALARGLDLGRYLLLGKGESLSGGREKNSLLANAYEALVGAIYRDSSLETATRILLPKLESEIKKFSETENFQDFKSELQEFTQVNFNCIPTYKVVRQHGPDHDKTFEVAVTIQGREQGMGSGHSKKEAEQAAARRALLVLT